MLNTTRALSIDSFVINFLLLAEKAEIRYTWNEDRTPSTVKRSQSGGDRVHSDAVQGFRRSRELSRARERPSLRYQNARSGQGSYSNECVRPLACSSAR